MEKHSQSMFARAVPSTVHILTQILMSWLVITLKWNTQVVSLVLKALCFQVKGIELDTFRCIENSYCSPEVIHFKVITHQDVRICVSIRTALNIALANIDCKGFSITRFIFYPSITFYLLFLSHLFYGSIRIIPKEFCNMVMY